ncbi:MAG: helix-turn-helix domain-containing protein [Phycisphaeraceae bacterium]|nr:helix-turn-helix domain-containing protein [Phycisphaeraceae bacterium]
MRTVGQIIKERRLALGLTLAGLASAVEVSKSYLSMIENHRVSNPPSEKLLRALERALDIADGELCRSAGWESAPPAVLEEVCHLAATAQHGQELAQWLLDSAGLRGDGARNLDQLFRSGELNRRIEQTLGCAQAQSPDLDDRLPIRFRVPLINRVAAGYPTDFTDLAYPARVADEYIPCPDLADPQAFAARVVGLSMLPDYRQGDIVVFSPAAKVEEGCDCFVRLEPDHQTTFKRVFFQPDESGQPASVIRLQPLNADFAPTLVPRERVAGLYRAVWRFQRL